MEEHKANCKKCDRSHPIGRCRAKMVTCYRCGERGHYDRCCPLKEDASGEEERTVGALTMSNAEKEVVLPIVDLTTRTNDREQEIPYLMDTGSEQCVIGLNQLKKFGHVELKPRKLVLIGVNGTRIKPMGSAKVTIVNDGNVYTTDACVVKKMDYAILDFKGLMDLRMLPDSWYEHFDASQLQGEEDESMKGSGNRSAKVHAMQVARKMFKRTEDDLQLKNIPRQRIEVGDRVKVMMGRPREKRSEALRGIVVRMKNRINKALIKLETGAYYWRYIEFVRHAKESWSERKGNRCIRSTHRRSDEPCPRTMTARGGGHE